MSWKYTKKINSNLKKPLDTLITEQANKIYTQTSNIHTQTNNIQNLIGTNNNFSESEVDFSSSTLMQKVNCLLVKSDSLQYAPSTNEEDILFSNINEYSARQDMSGYYEHYLGTFTPKFSGNVRIEVDFRSNIKNIRLRITSERGGLGEILGYINPYEDNVYRTHSATLNVEKGVSVSLYFTTANGNGWGYCRNFYIKGKEVIKC